MSAIRVLRQLPRVSARLARVQCTSTVLRAAALPRTASAVRALSVSASRFSAGTTDASVAAKLQEELTYEVESNAEATVPELSKSVKEVWQIEDNPGTEEIALHRKFGNETIKVIFSASDVQAVDEEAFENPEEEEEDSAEGDDLAQTTPVRVSMSVTKSNRPGSLNIDMVCQDGHFVVDNVAFYSDKAVGTELTAEADWKRRALYIGPQFDSLDISLQEEMEKYLQERGVNESLAVFIPEYAEYKEQQEYVQWLGNVKDFIEA
ncbi:mitochondrial glyco protein [Fistulina hepatica ATCC 64428]|uniref:Mitochondrial glyco protein n=1 Tax=Fistulina hepatica ATCC 64428 TaxID=1128425 RepID=A0A0D7ADA1_9AGAR|nr:mitochondrial glyco protein [Fistulina hepatica ATCC 64428]